VLYYEAMLDARARGALAADAIFRVEDYGADACGLAALAGFGGGAARAAEAGAAVVDSGARARVAAACGARGARAPAPRVNRRNKGLVNVTLADVRAVDAELAARVARVAAELGYGDLEGDHVGDVA
jgi:hypothetical protein